jgi:hypothetical protein
MPADRTTRGSSTYRVVDRDRDAARAARQLAVERSRQPRAAGEKFDEPLHRLFELTHPDWLPGR